MKNIFEVIRQKELEIQELQKQVETLRAAARLLGEDEHGEPVPMRAPVAAVPMPARPSASPMASAAAAGALKEFP